MPRAFPSEGNPARPTRSARPPKKTMNSPENELDRNRQVHLIEVHERVRHLVDHAPVDIGQYAAGDVPTRSGEHPESQNAQHDAREELVVSPVRLPGDEERRDVLMRWPPLA